MAALPPASDPLAQTLSALSEYGAVLHEQNQVAREGLNELIAGIRQAGAESRAAELAAALPPPSVSSRKRRL